MHFVLLTTASQYCFFHFYDFSSLLPVVVLWCRCAVHRILRETVCVSCLRWRSRFASIELWIKLFIVNKYIFTTLPVTAALLQRPRSLFFHIFLFAFFIFFLFLWRCGFGFCAFPERKAKKNTRNNAPAQNRKREKRVRSCPRHTIASLLHLLCCRCIQWNPWILCSPWIECHE